VKKRSRPPRLAPGAAAASAGNEINAAIELLKVPSTKRSLFGEQLQAAIREANRPAADDSTPPRGREIIARLDRLRKEIELLKPGCVGEYAGSLLAAAGFPPFEDLILDIDVALFNATKNEKTALRGGGRRHGSILSPRLEPFLLRVLTAGQVSQVEMPAYKDADTRAARGALVDTLRVLQPLLPSGFIPSSDATLVNAIDRLRRQIRALGPIPSA